MDSLLNESNILLDIKGRTNEDILEYMAKNLIERGYVKETYLPQIITREKAFPTGLPTEGVHVAIPHTDVEHVIEETISIGVLKESVIFNMMGGIDETVNVKLVFMLAMNNNKSQLRLLQRLMSILQDKELLRHIASEKNKFNIIKTFNKKFNTVEV